MLLPGPDNSAAQNGRCPESLTGIGFIYERHSSHGFMGKKIAYFHASGLHPADNSIKFTAGKPVTL
ncbi:hypothetical protein EGT74_08705 [Chitinophaga lutea]|uniref:Uncharacterized protein n=1 Tax=Chitinophaga lutea TaxID=2488634 RepID=A0A3N4QC81_9BACT|nr:hypothetical protein EGT74_08705 [Chitinophaga lutea]